jgi:hypothetical protein
MLSRVETITASRNFEGKSPKSIDILRRGKVDLVVLNSLDSPQQWLRAVYLMPSLMASSMSLICLVDVEEPFGSEGFDPSTKAVVLRAFLKARSNEVERSA